MMAAADKPVQPPALMAGDDRVIAGFKNMVQVSAANLMSDSSVAHTLYEQQKPVEHK